jgi:hypothetical protein
MDQSILFHKPNKKVRSKKKMDHFISQTKHTCVSRAFTLLHIQYQTIFDTLATFFFWFHM